MGKFKSEISWIMRIVLLTHLIWWSILGNLTYNGRALEIQDYDTFVIVPKLLLVGLTFAVLVLLMYLFRWVHARVFSRPVTIFVVALTTAVLIFLFFSWLSSLQTIRILGRSLYSETKGADRVQMFLLSHATLTFTVSIVALFDITMAYKLVPKRWLMA
jgi:hypothetical protein